LSDEQGESAVASSGARTAFIVTRSLGVGGVERKIADVCAHLSESRESTDLGLYVILDEPRPVDSNEAVFFDRVSASSAVVLRKPQQRLGPVAVPFLAFLSTKALTLQPTVILAFLRGPGLVSVLTRHLLWWRPLRVYISTDTVPSQALLAQVPNPVKRWLIRQLMRVCYPCADAILAPTEAARSDLVRIFGVPPTKIVVNRNWVRHHPADRSVDTLFDIICVGRVARAKNLTSLVRIIRQVRDVMHTLRACIVGGGEDADEVSRLSHEFGLDATIEFAGYRRDVSKYLQASRLFCLTSRYEGLPIAALEAMAHGLPVITTSYPGAEELVQDGVTGYICGSEEEYVARAVQLLSHEEQRKEMGDRARLFVQTFHGEESLKEFARLLLH
jgi:glycosyltransferase involved in cell wall biosynthesis